MQSSLLVVTMWPARLVPPEQSAAQFVRYKKPEHIEFGGSHIILQVLVTGVY